MLEAQGSLTVMPNLQLQSTGEALSPDELLLLDTYAERKGLGLDPDALAMQERYGELEMPIAVVAGTGDKIVDPDDQARRFHHENPHSSLHVVGGCGHMVHHTAPGRVM